MVYIGNLEVWKKVWKCLKKVWNGLYRGIFNTKPIYTLYILVAFNQEVFRVYMTNLEVWKKGVKTPKKGVKWLI